MNKFGTLALGPAALLLIGQGCPLGPTAFEIKNEAVVEVKDGKMEKKEGGTMMEEGLKVMMKGGVMMTEKNGEVAAMTDTMMTADGSKALMSGEVMMSDGTSIMLKEGESMMAKDSAMVKSEAMMEKTAPVAVTKSFTLTAKKWTFDPATITVKKGDTVKLSVKSIDVDHGFALSAFGINQNLTPGQTTLIEFVADKTGSFPFVCSVFCGSGHGGMRGT